jgi:hypothetical protein
MPMAMHNIMSTTPPTTPPTIAPIGGCPPCCDCDVEVESDKEPTDVPGTAIVAEDLARVLVSAARVGEVEVLGISVLSPLLPVNCFVIIVASTPSFVRVDDRNTNQLQSCV